MDKDDWRDVKEAIVSAWRKGDRWVARRLINLAHSEQPLAVTLLMLCLAFLLGMVLL